MNVCILLFSTGRMTISHGRTECLYVASIRCTGFKAIFSGTEANSLPLQITNHIPCIKLLNMQLFACYGVTLGKGIFNKGWNR